MRTRRALGGSLYGSPAGGGRWGPRRQLGFVSTLCLVALLSFPWPGAGAAASATDDCTYPLGEAAEAGKLVIQSSGADLEFAIIDGSGRHATKTALSIVPLWGTLHSVVDGRYRLADGGNRHNIIYKAWGANGWDSPVEYPSNLTVNVSDPIGSAVEPRAIGYKDKLWVAWEALNYPQYQNPDPKIVLRSRDSGGNWSDIMLVSQESWTSINRAIDLLVYKDQLLIAWSSMEGASAPLDFSIKGRFFDGQQFGPVVNISKPGDGWGELEVHLATDGEGIVAGFVVQNTSAAVPNYVPMLAAYDGASWSDAVWLADHESVESYHVSSAFFRGQLYVAYDLRDDLQSASPDFDVFVRTADPQTLTLGAPVQLTSPTDHGGDINPALFVYGEKMYLAWESDDDHLKLGSDLDLILTWFDGVAWAPPTDFTHDELVPTIDYAPKFLVFEEALHIYWIVDVRPPTGSAKDQRMATRLVERGPRWWDNLEATYSFAAAPVDGAPAEVDLQIRNSTGSPVPSAWYSVEWADGSWARLEPGFTSYRFNFTYNATPAVPFVVRACGKDLPTREVAGPDGSTAAPPKIVSVEGLVLPALALAGLTTVVAARGRPRL